MRSNRVLAICVLALVANGCEGCRESRVAPRDAATRAATGRVTSLTSDRNAHDAYGRPGDLQLEGTSGARLTFAVGGEDAGYRPLQGAIVDIASGANDDEGDSLLWWRAGLLQSDGTFVPHVGATVASMRCENGSEGVKIVGDAGPARIETHVCPEREGAFAIESRALRGMPAGAVLADELNTGAVSLLAGALGQEWRDQASAPWLAFGAHGVGAALEFDRAREIKRKYIEISAEIFRAEARVAYEPARAQRTLHIARGDVLDALARVRGARRRAAVNFSDPRGGTLVLRDAQGRELATVTRAGRERALVLPEDFGAKVDVRDHAGVLRVSEHRIDGTIAMPTTPMGVIRATYVDESNGPLPAKIIVRGIDGTPDPTFVSTERRFAAHSTLYALDGWAELPVRAGRYRVIGTRGPAYSLSVREVTVADGAVVEARDALVREVDTREYIAGDFHLHAAPSPDSSVSLPARVASLVCNGIEVAAATDHNAVTDYGPTARTLGLERWIATIAGDELTTSGSALGHFNVFPLVGRGYRAALPYHDVTAEQIVQSVRMSGASVFQVNHARMAPNIGYFDITGFDARTGQAGPRFASGFNALEAFNGMYLQEPERVREGVRDVVGLARAGQRVGATGNSDSHHLVFEEAGWPRTYARASGDPVELRPTRVMEAIRSGHTTVSSGPLVELWVDGVQPGDSLLRPGGARRVRARVRVKAARWVPLDRVELWVDDRVAVQVAVPPLAEGAPLAPGGVRFDQTFELTLDRDSLVIAWASAEQPLPHVLPPYPNARSIGFTSPVWVDATGDAQVTVRAAE